MDPQGKTALITGGAHRLGKAITLALAQAGCHVVINYHQSREAAETTAAEARRYGVDALTCQADVADHEQVNRMIRAAVEHFGNIDILVNSASRFEKTPFPTRDLSAWHRVTAILIHGAFYCANAVAPLMLQRGEGLIINIADLSAWQPWPGFVAHSVGKAALLALTRQLALELAPTVRVNALAPGLILPPPDYPPSKVERMAQRTLLRRWGNPEDVTRAVLYLVAADYVTGEVMVIDGGELLGRSKLG
ncbi:MAG: SDR family oxidoreductase [Anaerolineae bacterium]|nr:SDR family oxidoreductase [Anaerolineae bacterium]MDW8071885.1 SDR family oxidoreductase [Anaerolineae bacterium]